MKFPSIQQIFQGILKTLNRFPLELLISLLGTIVYIMLIDLADDSDQSHRNFLLRLLLVTILSLALSLASSLFAESQKFNIGKSIFLKVIILIIIVLVFFLFEPIDYAITYLRFGLLFVSFHLLVAVSPYVHNKNVAAFWEFNKQIFLRILSAILYSVVLYFGLCIAILTSDQLFNLDIKGQIYLKLWVIIVGLFNTTFFLAGIPYDWERLDKEQSYPKGLKIFTQYVLIPLATIYVAILLAYEVKIIAQWSLPKGWVSWLIVGYSVYGILSVLLIYPIRNEEGNRWINIFSRWFYFLLVPLIILLAVAVWTRVSQYGITENRYLLIILGAWLIGITIYFLSRGANIKVIPISLGVLALLATWGPQSAGSVAIQSQVYLLRNFFEQHGSFKNDKLYKLPDSVKTPKNIYAIPEYLVGRYPTSYYRDVFPQIIIDSMTTSSNTVKQYERYTENFKLIDQIRKELGMRYSAMEEGSDYYYASIEMDSIGLDGYKTLVEVQYNYGNDMTFRYKSDSQIFEIRRNNRSFLFLGQPLFEKLDSERDKWNNLVLKTEVPLTSTDSKAVLLIRNLSYKKEEKAISIQSCKAYLLMK